jgi:hypothetical protein
MTNARPKRILTVEDNAIMSPDVRLASPEPDDFALRCLVDEMVREGASEREIVRAVRARAGADSSAALPGPRRSLLQALPFVGRRTQGRAAA